MKNWLRRGPSACERSPTVARPHRRTAVAAHRARVNFKPLAHEQDRTPATSQFRVPFSTSATILGIALSLTACQTPAIKDRVVEVSVPIATKPLKPEQVPAVPAPLGPRPQSLSAAADVLLSKVCELEAYALKADPLLRLSAGIAQQPLRFPECER